MTFIRPGWAAVALATLSGAALAAQSAPADRSYRVGAFDKIVAAGPNQVIVHVGGSTSVTARGPAETLNMMEVLVKDGGLQIRPRREFRNGSYWNHVKPATFVVTMPRVTGATLAGSGDLRIDRAEGGKFAAVVAGSGTLDVATMRVSEANLSMAGSGSLTARGSATRADLSVAGSGNIKARAVTSRTAAVAIAGSGTAELTAQQTVDVSIVGSGDAVISGRARCQVTRIGSGRARCNA
jgi:hypothetical protein